jgi:hypothetical protein
MKRTKANPNHKNEQVNEPPHKWRGWIVDRECVWPSLLKRAPDKTPSPKEMREAWMLTGEINCLLLHDALRNTYHREQLRGAPTSVLLSDALAADSLPVFSARIVHYKLKKIMDRWADQALDGGDHNPFLCLVELYGQWLLNLSEKARTVASEWCHHARNGDHEAKRKWKAFCKALSRLIPGPPRKPMVEQFDEIYQQEYQRCKEVKKILNKRFRNSTTSYRMIQQRFQLSKREIDEGVLLKPRDWALKRTAACLSLSPEAARKTLLTFPPEKMDS